MSTIVEMLSSPIFSAMLGIAGLAAALLTYFLTRQRQALAFQQKGLKLLGHETHDLPQEVGVSYRGRPIPRVTKTFVVLWNAGEKVISGSDIVASDPLRLDVGEDAEILVCSLRATTRRVIAFDAFEVSSSTALLAFEFLDAGDGAVVEILHTGHEKMIGVLGTVKGLPRGLSDRGTVVIPRPVSARDPLSFDWLLTRPSLHWLILVASLFAAWFVIFKVPHVEIFIRSVGAVTAFTYTGLSTALLFRLRRKFPRALADALEVQE